MKIAILGWGSLIWQPKTLELDKAFDWEKDGPTLPIEFARISSDGRLTLVITVDGTLVRTLYALSTNENLDVAILNLAVREGSGRRSIGSYNNNTKEFSPENFKFKQNIIDWIESTDFDAVIWTNLSEKWEYNNEDGSITKIEPENRVKYLQNLKGNQSALAEEYIRKTPVQINTVCRTNIEKALGWTPIKMI